MDLSLVITNYKTPALLKLCLKSLKDTFRSSEFKKEIIVVDVESEKKNLARLNEDFPEVSFIPLASNVGYARAVNRGLRMSKGKYVLILNSDIVVIGRAVETLVEYLGRNPEVGLVGPRLLNFDKTPQYSCFKFYTPLTILCRRTFLGRTSWGKELVREFLMKTALKTAEESKEGISVDWILGAALMARRDALQKIGFMDERFFLYFEDVDWCCRFWENNYKVVYYPQAKMYHYHQRLSADKNGFVWGVIFNRAMRAHIISAWKYFWKRKTFGCHRTIKP